MKYFSYSCRHWSISKFFGDVKPDCNDNCDACKTPKQVSRAIEDLQRGSYAKAVSGKGGGGMYFVEDDDFGDDDMYGGGRLGTKRYKKEWIFDMYSLLSRN